MKAWLPRRIGVIFVALVFLALVIVGCASQQQTTMGIAQARPPRLEAEGSLQPTVEAAQVEQYLQAVQAQQTLAVIAARQTAVAIVGFQHATATAQAREQISWSATATAEAVRATATAEADAKLLAQQLTITAEAWEMNAQATAVAVAATATAEAARARREALAAKEAEMTYPLRAYGPWVGLAIGLIMLVYGGLRIIKIREARWGAIPRDPNGDAPIIVLPTRDGGRVVIDPDLALGPAIVVKREVFRPPMGPDDHLLQVAKADKAVEALTRPVLTEARHQAEAAKAQAKAMGKLARRPAQGRDLSQAAQLLRALRGNTVPSRRPTFAPRRPSPARRREQAVRTARDLMQGRGPYAVPSRRPGPSPSPYRIVPPRGAPRRWLDEVETRALMHRQEEEESDE